MGSREAAEKIYADLTGRSGFDLDLDDEIINEMIETWADIIDEETDDHTLIENWPDSLFRLSIATQYIELTKEQHLNIIACFLQEEGKIDQSLISNINDVAKFFPMGFMVKFCRSPKDSFAWYKQPKCLNGDEAFQQLIESERIFEDLSMYQEHGYTPKLAIREWVDIDPGLEFRCFIKDKKIVGISQYQYNQKFENLETYEYFIRAFLENELIPNLRLDSVVADIFLTVKKFGNQTEIIPKLLEINIFGPWTDPCLFNWSRPFDGSFRVVK